MEKSKGRMNTVAFPGQQAGQISRVVGHCVRLILVGIDES